MFFVPVTPTTTLIEWIEAAEVVLHCETALDDARNGAAYAMDHNMAELSRRVYRYGDPVAAAYLEKLTEQANAAYAEEHGFDF